MSTDTPIEFTEHFDPDETLDYVAEFGPVLEDGETIQSFTVEPTTDAAALGFEVLTTPAPALEAGSENVVFWVRVNPANVDEDIWCFGGVQIPIEVTVTTSVTPRRYQRTYLITVRER